MSRRGRETSCLISFTTTAFFCTLCAWAATTRRHATTTHRKRRTLFTKASFNRDLLFDFENAWDCTPALPPIRCLTRVPSEPSPMGSICTRRPEIAPDSSSLLRHLSLPHLLQTDSAQLTWPPARYPAGTGSSAIRPIKKSPRTPIRLPAINASLESMNAGRPTQWE